VVNTLIEQTYKDDSLKKFITEIILIVAAFLLIPALNLSNMIASRMENRMVEFGVRKSYGATNISIARQVLWENMLLTFAGGLLGLLLSIAVVSNADEWILYLFDSGESVRNYLYDMKRLGTPQLPFAMLFNVPLFVCTLLLCTMINILSAFIPLAASLRHSIVYSLNKRK
jgi:ABC-type antimicrobial peptide transport system permease subunit